jgi:LacI family transcriptional regulator
MSKKVVMQHIADRLNISKNSVSQALSGKDGVSEETRMKILKTAEEMGYTYTTRNAQAQAVPETKTIGLIASEFTFSLKTFFGEIYLAIEREAQRNNVNLLIQSITPIAKGQLALPSFIQNGTVDGILILSHISTEYILKVLSRNIPTVLIDHHHPLIQADAVLTNNRFGAYHAVKHLLDLKHTNIGVIGDVRKSPSYQERWEGYLLAMREYGFEPKQEHMLVDVNESEATIGQALRSLESQPTAWFCLNDGYSFYVNTILKQDGYEVPKDISLCGFDNSDFSQMAVPKITTIDINISLFARKAFSQLLWRMEQPNEPHQEILLPIQLIERESTAVCAR